MSAIVGIDLGTSNSVVAWEDELGSVRVLPDRAGTTIHPSVVSFVEGKVVGGVVVGAEAKARKITDPANTIYSFKRLMGQSSASLAVRQARTRVPYTILDGPDDTPLIQTCAGSFSPVELSAILLDHLREVSSEAIGRPVAHAVIAVPANFNDAQRSATASAGKIAGLDVLRVINEPTAAALAYGNTKRLHEIIAVYDFGGGTFDTTIMKLENQVYTVLGTAGDTFLGGDDFDERLVERMLAKVIVDHRVDLREDMVAMMRLRSIAEQLKIELSRQARAVVRVPEIARHRNTPVSLAFEITRDEFVSLVQDLVERTLSVTRDALSVAQIKIDRVSDVILVGGTTQIPYVRERVAGFFHKAARTDVSPEDAVAIGAALQAASLEQAMMRAPSAPVRVPFQLPEPTAPPPLFADPSVDTGFFFAEEPARVTPQPAPRLPTESLPIIDLDAIADEDEDSALDWALAQESAGVDYLDAALVAPRPVAPPPRPVVIDVTPSSFGITTIGGYCEMLIPRNTSLPFTIKKRFVTVRDAQDSVRIVVYQGETKRVETNTVLGEVLLTEIVPRPRGGVEIEVSFVLDSSGMLQVSAHDAVTGQLQHVDLDLVGRMGEDELAAARDRVRELRR